MPVPFIVNEGHHIDHFGNMIWSNFVDFREPIERRPICSLIKGCEAQYAMETFGHVRISRPRRFREFGESLILDPDEAHPQRLLLIEESIDDPRQLARAKQRDRAFNRASQLVGAGWSTETTSVSRTRSEGESLDAGKNSWIFSTSFEPVSPSEWKEWRNSMDDKYDHVSYIHRPRAFARQLASMAAQQLGPSGEVSSLSHSFEGLPSVTSEHPLQWIWHGPVIYVDDVYGLLESAMSKLEFLLLPLFAKSKKYQSQREYRFLIWSKADSGNLCEDMRISPSMAGNIGHRKRNIPPQWIPQSEIPDPHTAGKVGDLANRGEPDSEFGEEVKRGLGRELLDANSLEQDLFRSFSRPSNPSTVLKTRSITYDELPPDFQVKAATYAAVQALHNKISQTLKQNEDYKDLKLEITSAAWYAEQDIRALSEAFPDSVSGISLEPDGYIVIHFGLDDWPKVECKLAVAPSGESVVRLVSPKRHHIEHWSREPHVKNIVDILGEFIGLLSQDAKSQGYNNGGDASDSRQE